MKTFKAKKRHLCIRKLRFRTRCNTLAKQHTRRKKKRIINGGSLVGQGNFGCIFRPDIINGNKDIVSKIVLKTNIFNEYRHEYKILSKVSSIDPRGKFHSVISDAVELTPNIVPTDFNKCSLSRPTYDVKDFFVFNIKFCGTNNLTYYLNSAFRKTSDTHARIEPSVLFTLLTNIIVGIKKMVKVNVVHKTLDTDSIYLLEPVSLSNPYCEKIIDFGEGEVRKYDSFSDKYQDYVMLFSSIIKILEVARKNRHYDDTYNQTIIYLRRMFIELINMANMPKFSQDELIKKYIASLSIIFGESYSKYATSKYK